MRSKRLVITGISAIQAWDEGAMAYARPSKVTSPTTFAQSSAELRQFDVMPAGCPHPVEILVGEDSHRPRGKLWHAYWKSASLVPGSLWEIGHDRCLTSPEYFFVKTAPKLSVVRAVLLGMELCGYYSTLMSVPYREYRAELIRNREIGIDSHPWPPASWDMSLQHQKDLMENGFITRPPLVSPDDLGKHLGRALAHKSESRALASSRLVVADSHSPMESRLYARYCLPRKYGGLNLRPVELNRGIDLPDDVSQICGISKYSVDLYWPKAYLAIEYEGDFAHSGLTAEQKDRLKRNILETKGIRVISVDRKQYANEDVLELYARQIAKGMGLFPSELKPSARERAARNALIRDVTTWDYDLYRPTRR